jgi:hypothetical protein
MAEVGYRKPPKHTQFKKGQSGNPSGKRKGTLNLATVLTEALNRPVVIVEKGEKTTVSKMEAAVNHLMDKAAAGDTYAFRVLSTLAQSLEDPAAPPTSSELKEADQKILDDLFRRFIPAKAQEP